MDLPLSSLKGIGDKRLAALKAAGILTVRDIVNYLPREYRDLGDVRPLKSLKPGEPAAARARVVGGVSSFRSGALTVTRAKLADESGPMQAVWYNQPWLSKQLAPGRELLLYGAVESRSGRLQLVSPSIESGEGIRAVYRPLPGMPSKVFEHAVRQALDEMDGQWPDELPASVRLRHKLSERNFAMRAAHLPMSMEAAAEARRRLAFEEMLIYLVGLSLARGGRGKGVKIECANADADRFWESLPFPPTDAQKRVSYEVRADMALGGAMARMVQGDVGSGKTLIAFGAIYLAASRGYQSALMAPTEVLAAQHLESAQRFLSPLHVRAGLLTGSMGAKARREALAAIESGEWDLAIGTHALISSGVAYHNLGLTITDEQHRFGVRQRAALQGKGESPNVLVMSATPIPRTLALVMYGDLDVSVVDQLPPGRTPVRTAIVPEEKRAGMYGFLREEVAAGRQVYVVCPLVDPSEAVEALSAEQLYKELRDGPLKGLRLQLAHGRQKSSDKEAAFRAFAAGEIDVLVSTSVVEVGVNVPNASVMVIENAERFGLAQLHQLRGRVGRGAAKSWCFLMAEPNERLNLLASTNDGFEIARKDLDLRGPGDLIGFRQAGAAGGIASAMGDMRLFSEAAEEAKALMSDPDAPGVQRLIELSREQLNRRMEFVAMN